MAVLVGHPMSLKKRLVLCLAYALLLLLVAGGLWWPDASGKAAVVAAKERIRAAGLPLTIGEIRPPHVPDEDNAALVIERIKRLLDTFPALKRLQNSEDDFIKAHATAYRLNATGTHELAEMLDTQPVSDLLALIYAAAAKKGYDARLDYNKGPAIIVSNLGDLQRWAKLLRLHARLAVSRGQMEEVCIDIQSLTKLADFLADEPILISQLTRWAIWGMVPGELEQLASSGTLLVGWNQIFADRLESLNLAESHARGLDGERVLFGSNAFEQFMATHGNVRSLGLGLGGVDWPTWLRIMRYHIPGLLPMEYADYLDRARRVRIAVTQTPQSYVETIHQQKDALEKIPPTSLVTGMVLPMFSGVTKNLWIHRAAFIATRTGLALERFRVAKGRYPATLGELVPEFMRELPVDVFTGKPLIYRTEPGGAVVYSVGPNLQDDGGIEDLHTPKDDQGWASGTAALRKFAPVTVPAAPAVP